MRQFLEHNARIRRYQDAEQLSRCAPVPSCLCMMLLFFLLSACLPEAAAPTLEPTATRTPFPTPLPRATDTPALSSSTPSPSNTPAPTSAAAPNGSISAGVGSVDVRRIPGTAGEVIRVLRGVAPVQITGRTDDSQWLEVTLADGVTGWVLASSVQTDTNLAALAVTGAADNIPGVAIEPTPLPAASVKANAGGLRVRSEPGLSGTVFANLDAFDPLEVLARTFDDQWLQVRTPLGVVGWVAIEYVDLNVSLNAIPATRQTVYATATPLPSSPFVGAVSNVLPALGQIVQRGQELGNRPDVFSKVGDALTTSEHFFAPIGRGQVDLGEFGYLRDVITFYAATAARDTNSFADTSLAAGSGWTSQSVLSPALANTDICHSGETPLACEYRIVKPSIALIMLGTNDLELYDAVTYRSSMESIVQITLESGVIPVISTIPERAGYDVTPFNSVIYALSEQYGIPLWDYWRVLQTAPNAGLADDGVYPSAAAADNPALSADFRRENLIYGYTLRNLTGLLALDAVWRQVISTPQ